ncbi:MAG: hypothetical protein OEX82_01490 [Nitrosomonas sp.]|nr:hypothetical protein [Nitrosomonas sp.]
MDNFYNEHIGYESLLPNDIVAFLSNYQSISNKRQQYYLEISNRLTSILDEHELAMVE